MTSLQVFVVEIVGERFVGPFLMSHCLLPPEPPLVPSEHAFHHVQVFHGTPRVPLLQIVASGCMVFIASLLSFPASDIAQENKENET